MTIVFHSQNESDTRALGGALARALRGGDVVALNGELGSGKTCLVGGLAEGLGLKRSDVSSPTFVLCQEYGEDRDVCLIHIDAYRITGDDDLQSIGFDELSSSTDNIMVIEWADRICHALPDDVIDIRFEHTGPQHRLLHLEGPERVLNNLQLPTSSVTNCPICRKTVEGSEPLTPFCSERCRKVDMGRWLSGSYQISRPVEEDDLLE